MHIGSPELGPARGSSGEPELFIFWITVDRPGSWQLRYTAIIHFGSQELGLGRGSSGEPESCNFVPPEQDLTRGSSVKP